MESDFRLKLHVNLFRKTTTIFLIGIFLSLFPRTKIGQKVLIISNYVFHAANIYRFSAPQLDIYSR